MAPAPTAASAPRTRCGGRSRPEHKLGILAEYDATIESGEKWAILRPEGLYSKDRVIGAQLASDVEHRTGAAVDRPRRGRALTVNG